MITAFVTDLHVGGGTQGWFQQPRWVGGTEAIVASLGRLIAKHGVELLVVGGDVAEHGAAEEISAALDGLSGLGVPVAMVLGNHDLEGVESMATWRTLVARHARVTLADAVVQAGAWDVVVVNHPWMPPDGIPRFHWDPRAPGPTAAIASPQLDFVDKALGARPTRPAVVVLHAPLEPLGPALTGLEKDIHGEPPAYTGPLNAVLDRHANARLVLGGHCHVNCATARSGRVHLTTAAVCEAPCEVRLLDFSADVVTISTHRLDVSGAAPAYNETKAWVNGRAGDRDLRVAARG